MVKAEVDKRNRTPVKGRNQNLSLVAENTKHFGVPIHHVPHDLIDTYRKRKQVD
jgi:hypothetical protein